MTRTQLITGIAVVAALAVVAVFFIFNSLLPTTMDTSTQPAAAAPSNAGLTVQDEMVGTGAVAEPGDNVVVTYVGKLQDGTIFDQSSAHTDIMPGCSVAGQFCFTLGAGMVIPGWDEGLQGMKVGGKRLLIIPPSLGYGSQVVGPIPANSTLVFEIDLLAVNPATTTPVAPEGPAAD